MRVVLYQPKDLNVFFVAFALLTWFSSSVASAQCEQAKLTAADAAREDYFGASVDIDGDVAIVGAMGSAFLYDDAIGAAYVFRKIGSAWVQEQKLVDPMPQPGVGFGLAVAIEGDVAMVTAPGDHDALGGAGAVHVFRYDGSIWVHTQKLFASDPAPLGQLGISVAIDGPTAAIGQVRGGPKSSPAAVYVFRWNGTSWVEEQKLFPPDLGDFDQFAGSVAINGNYIVAGAPVQDPSGAAYVFHWNGTQWVQQQKLTASDGSHTFGRSVAIYEDVIVIGAPQDEEVFTLAGSAYIFHFNGANWVQQQKLLPPGQPQSGYFGISVSVEAGRLLVGSPSAGKPGPRSGAAYLYAMNEQQWSQPVELIPSDAEALDGVGIYVAVSAQNAIVGAYGTDDECPGDPFCESGAAYVYDVPVCAREIPTASTWGLVAFTLSVMSAGVLLLRKRQKPVQLPPHVRLASSCWKGSSQKLTRSMRVTTPSSSVPRVTTTPL